VPSVPLVPLFRLSFACNHPQYSNANAASICTNNPQHTDTTYTTDQAGINSFASVGYRVDGIEGYIYPKTITQPTGTVRLMRKYNAARDDHAIFPESLLMQYTNEGYTLNSGSDWLGYVYLSPSNGSKPIIQ
jgi:serine protease